MLKMSSSHPNTQPGYRWILPPWLRKTNVLAHIVASIGWLGAVIAFLALSVAGLNSASRETVLGAYLAMNLIGQFVIVPLSLFALVTGLVAAFGSEWGLTRYYWVLTKFVLTLGSASLLMLHQFTVVSGAAIHASDGGGIRTGSLTALGRQLVFDSVLAIAVLLGVAALSVFKPWGKIVWTGSRLRAVLIAAAVIFCLMVLHHIFGGEHGHQK